MTTEEKALALALRPLKHVPINSATVRLLQGYVVDMVSEKQAAIEAHEADKKAFSDAVVGWMEADRKGSDARRRASEHLTTFILPEPDPLVEIAREMTLLDGVVRTDNQKAAIREGRAGSTASDDFYDRLRMALPARGYKIERIDND